MKESTRREFLRTSSWAGLGLFAAGCAPKVSDFAQKSGRRVVVIGGGWGGTTAAKYVRLADPSIEVVLLEPNKEFVSCPFSNLVLSGQRTIESLTFSYDRLRAHGVRVLHETATMIEPDARRVQVGRDSLPYDRLIVSPGVEFQWDQVEGLAAAQDRVLHAWKAGPQTVELARQLQAMPDGGVFVLTIPPAAYRCPPGPYERTCQVAWYLKNNKPKSKLIVLDANPNIISKTALFRAAWASYPNIEYRGSNKVVKVDPGTCEVNHLTYESVKHKNIHVIGDSTIGLPVPKSGNIANAMGKISALAVVSLLSDKPVPPMAPGNTCYSWVSDREAIAVVNAYKIEGGKVVQIEQKLTPGQSEMWAQNAVGWATSIWQDMLG